MVARTRRANRRPETGPRGERLQKILAAAGLASRRSAENLIREGRVRVDGRVVTELGTRADPSRQRITLDKVRIPSKRPRASYVVYKPRGVVTTARDPHAKKTVLDLVPKAERLFPVGRLDAPSEGLLLVTNDGDLAQRLLHPSFEVPRIYRVSVAGELSAETARQISAGVELAGRRTAPCEVRVLAREPNRSVIEITLIEGRRRQIRRMLEMLGHPVRRLLRTGFGPLRLGTLKPGGSRPLRRSEELALDRLAAQHATGPGRRKGREVQPRRSPQRKRAPAKGERK